MAFVNSDTQSIHAKVFVTGPDFLECQQLLGTFSRQLDPDTKDVGSSSENYVVTEQPAHTVASLFSYLPLYMGNQAGFDLHMHLYCLDIKTRMDHLKSFAFKGLDGVLFLNTLDTHHLSSNISFYHRVFHELSTFGSEKEDLSIVHLWQRSMRSGSVDAWKPLLNPCGDPCFVYDDKLPGHGEEPLQSLGETFFARMGASLGR
jgi:hypothetical protein